MTADKKSTITDIARDSGFSESTVSLVINNSPKISGDTRAKVLSTIERHGYQPNTQARGLAMRASRTLSIIVPELPHVFADPYFGEIISGIHAHATDADYKVLVDVATMKFIRTQEHLNILAAQRADGLLFIGASQHDQYLSAFNGSRHPFLMVNNYFSGQSLNHVSVDHRESARLAAGHLAGLGHRVIGSIHGSNIQTALDFQQTFDECLRDAGVAPADMPRSDGRFSEEKGFEAAQVLFSLNPRITALVCGNLKMAAGVLRFLALRGKKVPGDVSVLAIEDAPMSGLMKPQLTTVVHPVYNVGMLACKNLIALARREIERCQMLLPPELAVRESTGPART